MPARPVWGILAMTMALVAPAAAQKSHPSDEAQVRSLIGKYVHAADTADPNLAGEVWEQSDEVSVVNPAGRFQGWPAIKSDFYQKEMGETFAERHLNVHHIRIHVNGNSAWSEFNWDFAAKYRSNGKLDNSKGMETQIYRRTANGWRLVHVHYSLALAVK